MDDALALAQANLGSPVVLSFALGLGAALLRSDLAVPEAAAKAISIYLLFAIGFKGGAAAVAHGPDARLLATVLLGVLLSFGLPFVAFALLRALTRLGRVDAAAVAAHYGSISIVTFVAATSVLDGRAIPYEGYMVAVAAAMEAPAILSALWLARGGQRRAEPTPWGEVLLNGSIVLLVGAFAIGALTGSPGLARIEGFITIPFQGVLCLFLLDMGLVAGRGLRDRRAALAPGAIAFAVLMPLVGGALGLGAALLAGLSPGGAALLTTLAASASYIAVPAALRVALPEADPSVYLTLSLGVTFPFNITLGLPLYVALATGAAA